MLRYSNENMDASSTTKNLQSKTVHHLLEPTNIGEQDKKRTLSSLEDTTSSTGSNPIAPQGTSMQHVSKKARMTGKFPGNV